MITEQNNQTKKIILVFSLSLSLFLLMLWLPAPDGLSLLGWRTAAIAVLMAVWWATAIVPLPITALLPLILFPLFNINSVYNTGTNYGHPIIFLFLGGFIMALAMQRWNLHKRLALNIINRVGESAKSILLGFMLVTAFLSMWMSNTAATLVMIPIALSLIQLQENNGEKIEQTFCIALLLGITYAATIGGAGTLIGTPPNLFLAAYMEEIFDISISFARWMLFGVPIVVLVVPLVYWLFTRILLPFKTEKLGCGNGFVKQQLEEMGKMHKAEKIVAIVFTSVALLWLTRAWLQNYIPNLSDTGIAIAGAILLFLLPVNLAKGEFVMDWKTAQKLPWDVLILFGGGLSLAAAFDQSGLAVWIANHVDSIADWPLIMVIAIVAILILFLTELTSNTATSATFIPILAAISVGLGYEPLLLAATAALASNFSFMLPVGTPPNAIVYATHKVSVHNMIRTGFWLNILLTVIITLAVYYLLPLVFG